MPTLCYCMCVGMYIYTYIYCSLRRILSCNREREASANCGSAGRRGDSYLQTKRSGFEVIPFFMVKRGISIYGCHCSISNFVSDILSWHAYPPVLITVVPTGFLWTHPYILTLWKGGKQCILKHWDQLGHLTFIPAFGWVELILIIFVEQEHTGQRRDSRLANCYHLGSRSVISLVKSFVNTLYKHGVLKLRGYFGFSSLISIPEALLRKVFELRN